MASTSETCCTTDLKVGFMGAGRMAYAITRGIVNAGRLGFHAVDANVACVVRFLSKPCQAFTEDHCLHSSTKL